MASCNPRGTAEWIKGGKYAIIWTLLSCHGLRASAVRLRAHMLANNLANLLRTLALPARGSRWSLTALREKLVKIGAKVVRRGRSAIFQLAEAAVPRGLFKDVPRLIARLRAPPAAA